jgi:hypothetical protein
VCRHPHRPAPQRPSASRVGWRARAPVRSQSGIAQDDVLLYHYYYDNLATEAKKGAWQKAKFGGTPYKPPIGYLTAWERIEGREIRTVIVDLERAPLVRWAFTAYATGDYTLRELTEELERRGLKFEQSRKLPARAMTLSAVNNMLTNRYYLGMVRATRAPALSVKAGQAHSAVAPLCRCTPRPPRRDLSVGMPLGDARARRWLVGADLTVGGRMLVAASITLLAHSRALRRP